MNQRLLLVVLASVFAGATALLVIAAVATGTPFVLVAAVPLGLTAVLMWYQGTGRLAARVAGGRGARRRDPRTTVGGTASSRRRAGARDWDDGDHRDDGGPWEDPFWREAQREARNRARRSARRTERRRARQGSRERRGAPGTGERRGAPGADERRGGRGDGERRGARGASRRGAAGAGRRRERAETGPTAAEAYRTLDLEPGAGQDAIREAYREKVKALHPDADGGDVEAFKAVTAAYERLAE